MTLAGRVRVARGFLVAEFIGLDALADALGAALAPLVTFQPAFGPA